MNQPIGVIATVGPDPGLTAEQRRKRARKRQLEGVVRGLQRKVETLEARMLTANQPERARFEVKAEAARQEIAKAKAELNG